MKKTAFKITQFNLKLKTIALFFLIVAIAPAAKCNNAKTNPIPQSRAVAFRRAKGLDNGISISWLEQTWNPEALKENPLKNTDFQLLKKLGFKTIRLPVAFEFYQAKPGGIAPLLSRIDNVLAQCRRYRFKLIIDYHYGEINDTNYTSATQKAINTWLLISKRYGKVSGDELFFEIYNEPPHMDPAKWKDAAYNITTAIRKADPDRTLLVGASNYNSIYELSRFVRLSDENIIYTFHFYEPFFFTHQGAAWVGDQVATTGVAFPYNEKNFPQLNPKAKNTWGETNYYQYAKDGNEQSVKDKLGIVKAWGDKYVVPLVCTEFGVYNKYADLDSRCRYIKAVKTSLRALKIPGILWDYHTNFSIFTGPPSEAHLPPCMRDALAPGKPTK
ncbi:glycoside hydrolase family 5 protein [Mucilaginibacter sp. RS28]|uniref:Glycoside hydrolase family 5 protein n=1 Tax=Mucilaginibacter straminoryzae TaxID=2932774 RepID=A0A9X2BA93_9SPHI|nr:cellulase family glycosylhydrolase [Mucilaginibacter straminoryzae]MCJ8211589.1 glycoside hydrolase family 5 protein [Mucilaginibacter straminoryzae]